MSINRADLIPDHYYWARRENSEEIEVVQVSTIFGSEPDYLTVAVMSSDQHYSLQAFDFIAPIKRPEISNATVNVLVFPELRRMKW